MPRVESFFTFFDQVNVQDPTMLFGKSGGGGVGCERSMGWWVMGVGWDASPILSPVTELIKRGEFQRNNIKQED